MHVRTTADTVDQPATSEAPKRTAYCALPYVPPRQFGPQVNPHRADLVLMLEKKWVSGTVLHYYFFDQGSDGENVVLPGGATQWRPFQGTPAQEDMVRAAFKTWAALGLGLIFEEVKTRDEAEIRIGFMEGDGAWSYIGRDAINLKLSRDERTMNFGWDIASEANGNTTALHEVGHALGFSHEHQNPVGGLQWNKDKVYEELAQPPNSWSREQIEHNVLNPISPDSVQASEWDPNSVMHYPFPGTWLLGPPPYHLNGISPPGGLSPRDRTWALTFYPPPTCDANAPLIVSQSVPLTLTSGGQRHFCFSPPATRTYTFSTFGSSDTVLVLFEETGGTHQYVAGDDDSGEERNATIKVRLYKGRTYMLRLRLYYTDRTSETAIMVW